MIHGIDISEDQGSIDFIKVKKFGIGFVYAKATEGHTIQDSLFREYHNQAKSAGIPFGPYHFFHFGSSTPQEQAENFLSQINGYEGQLLPMVDVEAGSQDHITDISIMISRLAEFLDLVEKSLNGKKCIIYTGYSFWNDVLLGTDAFAGHLSWVAAYQDSSNPVPVCNGFKSTAIWQWNSSGKIPGIDTNVDLDILYLPLENIRR